MQNRMRIRAGSSKILGLSTFRRRGSWTIRIRYITNELDSTDNYTRNKFKSMRERKKRAYMTLIIRYRQIQL